MDQVALARRWFHEVDAVQGVIRTVVGRDPVTIAMLKATELGLGTCWIGAFDEEKVTEAAGLPPYLRAVAILTVGYEK